MTSPDHNELRCDITRRSGEVPLSDKVEDARLIAGQAMHLS